MGISVMTPSDELAFIRYFAGIDQALARRFTLGFAPDEEHITSLLAELFDSDGSKLHALPYGIDQLNYDLNERHSLLRMAIDLETTTYSKHQENRFTYSDLGLIVDYRDSIDPSLSFTRGVLVQAKRLFPGHGRVYSLDSRYESFNPAQHASLMQLAEGFAQDGSGGECIWYLFYNPPVSAFNSFDQERVIHRQLSKETSEIFDFGHGLALYNTLAGREGVSGLLEIGSMFASVHQVHQFAAFANSKVSDPLRAFPYQALVDSIDLRQAWLPWFIVYYLLRTGGGCDNHAFLNLVSGGGGNNPQIPSPRYILRIGITAGTEDRK